MKNIRRKLGCAFILLLMPVCTVLLPARGFMINTRAEEGAAEEEETIDEESTAEEEEMPDDEGAAGEEDETGEETVSVPIDETAPTVESVDISAGEKEWYNASDLEGMTFTITASDGSAETEDTVDTGDTGDAEDTEEGETYEAAAEVSGVRYVYVDALDSAGSVESTVKLEPDASGSFMYSPGTFEESVTGKTYNIYAEDAAGNVSETFTVVLNVDPVLPDITDVSFVQADGSDMYVYDDMDGVLFANRAVIMTVAAADDENGSGVSAVGIYEGGILLGECTDLTVSAGDGTLTAVFYLPYGETESSSFDGSLTIRAEDISGNISDDFVTDEIIIEDGSPSGTIGTEDDAPASVTVDGIEYPCFKDDATINFTAADSADETGVASGIRSLKVTVNGEVKYEAAYSDSRTEAYVSVNTASCTIDGGDGSYTAVLEVSDCSGNTYTESFKIYKDDTPPSVDSVSKSPSGSWTADDVTVTIVVSDADGACNSGIGMVKYGISDDYDEAAEARLNNDGTAYIFTQTVEQCNKYYVWAEDLAGNVSAASTIYVRIDRTEPEITNVTFEGTGFSEGDNLVYSAAEDLPYGYYFSTDAVVTVSVKDVILSTDADGGMTEMDGCGTAVVYYRLVPYDSAEEGGGETIEGAAVKNGDGTFTFTAAAGFKGEVLLKAVDELGNEPCDDAGTEDVDESFCRTGDLILETEEDNEDCTTLIIEIPETEFSDNEGQPIYSTDITAKLTVSNTYAGIRQVDWYMESPYDTGCNQAGTIVIDNEGRLSGDTDGWTVSSTDDNLITCLKKNVEAKADSNDIVIHITLTDRAGYITEYGQIFSIDKTDPVIEVVYDNYDCDQEFADEAEYYDADRVATVTVTERNFDAGDVIFDIYLDGEEYSLSVDDWEESADFADPNQTTYTGRIEFSMDGEYAIDISFTDLAGNAAEKYGTDVFVIDKTIPLIDVTFDNEDAQNGIYYNASRTATVTIEERNFETTRLVITGTSALDGEEITYPSISSFTDDGNYIHTATIPFMEDGDYTLKIEYTDKAGNEAYEYTAIDFTIDQTPPELEITKVEDMSANAGEVAPLVTWSDINSDGYADITLTGSNQGALDPAGDYYGDGDEGGFQFYDFEYEQSADDIYILEATAWDLAGNETTQTLQFSVNRFGSVYSFEPGYYEFNGTYISEERDIVITETNVDFLDMGSIQLKVSKDGVNHELEEGTDYEMEIYGGGGEWSRYTYTIYAGNFSEEGVYTVTVVSEDEAGNVNDSSEERKAAEIRFGIDKTAPRIVAVNISEGGVYAVDVKTAVVSVGDNLVLADVEIYVNGAAADYECEDDRYTFEINESEDARCIEVVACDAAGNRTQLSVGDFYVTENLYIRWYNNVPLRIATIAAGSAAAAVPAAWFYVRYRRRVKRRRAAEVESRIVKRDRR